MDLLRKTALTHASNDLTTESIRNPGKQSIGQKINKIDGFLMDKFLDKGSDEANWQADPWVQSRHAWNEGLGGFNVRGR